MIDRRQFPAAGKPIGCPPPPLASESQKIPSVKGYIESFNGKLRDELLNREIFYTLTEAEVLLERWRIHYNTKRPHSSLGYRPPAPEAIQPPTNLTDSMTGLT